MNATKTETNDTAKAIDAALLAKLVSDGGCGDLVTVATEALERIADDLAMMQIAEEADGGITTEFRERYVCAMQCRAGATAEAIRRLARKEPAKSASSKPGAEASDDARTTELQAMRSKLVELEAKVMARTATDPVYPSDLRDAVQQALAGAVGARSILPSDELSMKNARAQLDDAVEQLGLALSIMAWKDGAA